MSQSVKTNHGNIPYLECPQYLAELMQCPSDYENIMENYTGRVISRLAFGVPDHYLEIRQYSHGLLKAISPAAYITNIIPQLRFLPSWVSPWKWTEKRRHAEERVFFMRMHDEVAARMNAKTAKTSFMRHVLERKVETGLSDEEAAYIVGMIGLAGVLTTSSALMTYLLAMTLYPEWQARLQTEVDTICGERMPELSDAPRMPILRAVIMELLRWRPITPSSMSSLYYLRQ
jgi:cytochrome P450